MTMGIRQANLETDKTNILGLLQENFSAPFSSASDQLRFNWLYCHNPGGLAWSWLAVAKGPDKVVGVASLFPRPLWVDDHLVNAGMVGDFAVQKDYRSLGPALMLQRAAFEPVEGGELTLCYDCPPHDRGMATFVRLGMKPSCDIYRYNKVIKLDPYVERFFGGGLVGGAFKKVANLCFGFFTRKPRTIPGIEVSLVEGSLGEEYSLLDKRVSSRGVIRSSRNAELLNWRYKNDPIRTYHILSAHRHGELMGYVIFSVSNNIARVFDIFGELSGGIGLVLLDGVYEFARKNSVQKIETLHSKNEDIVEIFQKAGYKAREMAVRVVVHFKPQTSEGIQDISNLIWKFSFADVAAFPRRP